MFRKIYIFIIALLQIASKSVCQNVGDMNVKDIANNLGAFLKQEKLNATVQKRFDELNEKLAKISKYVIDSNAYAILLLNETQHDDLKHISFFKALHGNDSSVAASPDSDKSLYQKMADKMNRDDIVNILTERDPKFRKMFQVARRSGVDQQGPKRRKMDNIVNAVMTKLLSNEYYAARKSSDDSFDSTYWDPAAELEDQADYYIHSNRRLFKGLTDGIKKYPFLSSVHLMGRFWCGGVLYASDLVITSSSCLQLLHNNQFFRENPRVLSVRVGSNHSLVGGESIDAIEVYFHPAYNPKTLLYNIAVIRLQRHIYFTNKDLPKLIRVSKDPRPLPSNVRVLTLGWGVTKAHVALKYEPTNLRKLLLPIYPNYMCKQVYNKKFIKESMFCAGTMTTGEGACDHDAGGPAILGGRLVGIISFGPAVCGEQNAPTVFTHVGFVANWLESIRTSMPGYHQQTTLTTLLPTRPPPTTIATTEAAAETTEPATQTGTEPAPTVAA